MKIIVHRINKIEQLLKIPKNYGVEIDIRGFGSKLLLSHDPVVDNVGYDELEEYLKNFHHSFIIFDLKEAGYENRVIELAKKYGIENYFVLDVEFPYFYRATRVEKFRKIAVRFSEAEPIEFVKAQMIKDVPLVDWVWIDTNTVLPLAENIVNDLKPFKTCLVCPDRWGRAEDILPYIEKIKNLKFNLDAVMTAEKYAEVWDNQFNK